MKSLEWILVIVSIAFVVFVVAYALHNWRDTRARGRGRGSRPAHGEIERLKSHEKTFGESNLPR